MLESSLILVSRIGIPLSFLMLRDGVEAFQNISATGRDKMSLEQLGKGTSHLEIMLTISRGAPVDS